MLDIGTHMTLTIVRQAEQGLYLQGENAEDECLLPRRYVTPQMRIGNSIRVFLYLDQEERIVATTEQPLAQVGQFALLRVAWTNQYGAFLHWGLMKDLFCPFREQRQRMQTDRSYIVYVKIDEESYRLMASAKVEKFLTPCRVDVSGGQHPDGDDADDGARARHYVHGTPVDCLIWQKTDLGYKVIVDNRHQGLVYNNQIFQPLAVGDRLTAYVDHVRQDGKIDLTLQTTGHRHTLDFAQVLLRYLHENNGYCNLDDHASAELIADRFKVSKKVFKRAIGDLYRRRLITLAHDGLHLA